jgi:hypothetical protein
MYRLLFENISSRPCQTYPTFPKIQRRTPRAELSSTVFCISHHVTTNGLEISGTIVGRISSTIRIDMVDLYRKTPRNMNIFYKLSDTIISMTDLARTAWSHALGLNSSNSKIEAGDVWKVVANGRVAEKLSGEYSNMAPTYGVWAH